MGTDLGPTALPGPLPPPAASPIRVGSLAKASSPESPCEEVQVLTYQESPSAP